MPEILDAKTGALPIVYRTRRRNIVIVLAASIVFIAIGIYLIAENSNRLIGTADVFRARIPSFLFGWLATLLGIVGSALTGVTLLRDRPRIELTRDAVVQYPRLAAPRGWAWQDIARITVRRQITSSSAMGDEGIDSIVLVMNDGREVSFVAPDDAEAMKEAMESVKARSV